jgi:hypothetical protein
MKTIRERLQEADPLQYEPVMLAHRRDQIRQATVAAASVGTPKTATLRPRIAIVATVVVAFVAVLTFGPHRWPLGVVDLQAAVRFEMRLAESSPASGLREMKVLDSDRTVYVYEDVVVSNSDISRAQVIDVGGPSRFGVAVEFTAEGAQKMQAATTGHIGKPVAILVDGEVVMAPTLRAPISTSAVINGDYTRAQAERIANGIGMQ